MNLYAYCGNDPVNEVDPTGLSDASDAILTDYWKGLNADNVLDARTSHFLPWVIGRTIFFDAWVMTGRGIKYGFTEARKDLRGTAATSTDPVERGAAQAVIPLTYFGQASADFAVLEGQAGTYGAPFAGVSTVPPAVVSFGKPVLTGVTLLGTGSQAVNVGSSLLTPEGRDTLTVEDWVDLSVGSYASWHLTGGTDGPLNLFNWRPAIAGASENGSVYLGANRWIKYGGKSITSPDAGAKLFAASQPGWVDPYSNKLEPITGKVAADHFVPAKELPNINPKFALLSKQFQEIIANNVNNIKPLPPRLNSSNGGTLPSQWTSALGKPLSAGYIADNTALEREVIGYLRAKIDFLYGIQTGTD